MDGHGASRRYLRHSAQKLERRRNGAERSVTSVEETPEPGGPDSGHQCQSDVGCAVIAHLTLFIRVPVARDSGQVVARGLGGFGQLHEFPQMLLQLI